MVNSLRQTLLIKLGGADCGPQDLGIVPARVLVLDK